MGLQSSWVCSCAAKVTGKQARGALQPGWHNTTTSTTDTLIQIHEYKYKHPNTKTNMKIEYMYRILKQ